MKGQGQLAVSPSTRSSKGYTLIELIMVTALTAVLLSVSVAAYYNWTRSTSSDTAITKLGVALTRARSHALSRQRSTRVSLIPDSRGSFVVVERQQENGKDEWYPIAPSNRLAWTMSAKTNTYCYFRQDGSCCREYEDLDEPDSEEDFFTIDLENISGRNAKPKARGRFRTLHLDPRSGLYTIKERSYDDDGH